MATSVEQLDVAQRTRRRVGWRLLPFLFVLYIIAFLDRVNVGYAGLEMARDLAFSDRVFGLGAGIFSIGYFIFEIPGALIVERWSARRWIARILITWGLVTILVAAVHTPRQFYVARFLLGVAEAGFFPGLLVYLTHWFRYEDRAKAGAMFMAAIPMSNILGAPLAGWILSVRWLGLPGWRWLFVAEGIPAVLFGVLTLWLLTDWPREARWLPSDEREWLTEELRREKEAKARTAQWTVWQALRMSGGDSADGGVFPGDYRDLRVRDLVSDDCKARDRTAEWRGDAAVVAALCGRAGRDAAERMAFGPHGRAALAYGVPSVPRWRGAGANADRAWEFVGGICRDDRGGRLQHGVHAEFLGVADRIADGVGGRSVDRIHQFGGNLGGFAGPYFIGYLRTATGSFAPGLAFLLACTVLSGAAILMLRRGPNASGG